MRTFNLPALGEEQYVLTLNKRELIIILHLLGSVSGDHLGTWREDADKMYDQLYHDEQMTVEMREMLDEIYKASDGEITAVDTF